MSYLVIARKYRPRRFEDVIGQDHITTTLKNAIESGRLAHAYIFSGPRGTGKTTTARILAKTINCEKGPTTVPCDECTNCLEIAAGRSMDVLEIDGASNRGIDEIRSLRDNVRYTPVRGGYKIYIIDEFHMITKDAFNALLKTLEEPPPQVIFIFATTEPNKVLPTILSRCQRFDFKRVPVDKIVGRLRQICDEEKLTIDDESLHAMAHLSEGGMRDSLTMLDQVISFCGTNVTSKEMREAIGLIGVDVYFETMNVILGKDLAAGFKLTEKVIDAGWDLSEFLHGLLEHIRNLLLTSSCGAEALTEIFEGYRKRYMDMASRMKAEDLLRMMNVVSETIQRLKWSLKQRYIFELMLFKLIRMEDSVDLRQLLDHLDNPSLDDPSPVKKKVEPSKPAEVSQETKTLVASKPDAAYSSVVEQWPSIQERVKQDKIRLASVLEHARPVSLVGQTLHIELAHGNFNEFHAEIVMKEREFIGKLFQELCGLQLKITCGAAKTMEPTGAVKSVEGGVQNSVFDHYPTVQDESSEVKAEEQDTSDLFKYVRDLEGKEPFKSMIDVLGCELLDVSYKPAHSEG